MIKILSSLAALFRKTKRGGLNLNTWLKDQVIPIVQVSKCTGPLTSENDIKIVIEPFQYWCSAPFVREPEAIIVGESFYQYLGNLDPLFRKVAKWMKNDLDLPDIQEDYNELSFISSQSLDANELPGSSSVPLHVLDSSQLFIGQSDQERYQMLVVLDIPDKDSQARRTLAHVVTLIRILAEYDQKHAGPASLLSLISQPATVVGRFNSRKGSAYCFVLKK